MQSINIYPFLKTWKPGRDGRCSILLSVDVANRRVAVKSLARKVLPEHWDASAKKVRDTCPNASLINALIRNQVAELDGEFTRKQLLNISLTKDAVRRQVRGNATGTDFYKFCREQIPEHYKDSDESLRTMLSQISKLEQFEPAVSFADIDYSFLVRYRSYMADILGNRSNTIWKSMGFIRRMFNIAKAVGGIVGHYPFEEFEIGEYQQGIPDYLEWAEVEKLQRELESNHAVTPTARSVGWYFMLSCCSGLRFSDALKFSYQTSVIHDAQGERLLLNTQKNGEIVSIAFTSRIRAAIQAILASPQLTLTNQAFNRELKILAGVARLSKPLHHHMGRHTFAMRCAELDFSEEDTRKLLGHRDTKSTRIYYRIKNRRLDKVMSRWDAH